MAYDWTSLINPAISALGTAYTANQATDAANTAAQMSQFRPVGVTTRFGKSGFTYDPATGQLTGAQYQVAPDVAAMREGLLGMAGTGLGQAQAAMGNQPIINQAGAGLFQLGQKYLATSPEAAAQQWMTQQQNLLAPGREQETAQLANKEFQRGTLGLATGGTTTGYGGMDTAGLAASNPRFAELMNARALADATMAANAQKYGQAQTQFGQGLLTGAIDLSKAGYGLQTAALAPYTQYLQGAKTAEELGQNAFTQGTSLGSSITAAQQLAAQQYLKGQQAQQAALQGTLSTLADPIAQLIKGLI